jgi:hypothetical protein
MFAYNTTSLSRWSRIFLPSIAAILSRTRPLHPLRDTLAAILPLSLAVSNFGQSCEQSEEYSLLGFPSFVSHELLHRSSRCTNGAASAGNFSDPSGFALHSPLHAAG